MLDTSNYFVHQQSCNPYGTLTPGHQTITYHIGTRTLESEVGPWFFNGAHKQTLWLQHCDLTAIPASIDSLVGSLRRLDLSDNYVITLKPLHGVQFDKLSILSLHRNRIVHIDSERLFLPPLFVVHLQHNLLITLSEPKKVGALTAFLEGNPWHCNASLGWLLRGLHSDRFGEMHYHHKESDVLLRDVHQWTCATPSLYQMRPVVEVLPIVATLANKGENYIQLNKYAVLFPVMLLRLYI